MHIVRSAEKVYRAMESEQGYMSTGNKEEHVNGGIKLLDQTVATN